MHKQINILVGVIVLIIVLGLALQPFMLKHKAADRAKNTVVRALEYWKNGDAASGRLLWEDPSKFPTEIYDLSAYEIQKVITQQEGNTFNSTIFVSLDFNSESLLPSGKIWVFETHQEKMICAIEDFYIMASTNP